MSLFAKLCFWAVPILLLIIIVSDGLHCRMIARADKDRRKP